MSNSSNLQTTDLLSLYFYHLSFSCPFTSFSRLFKVPFARYVAMNKLANIKRYHIAKVYRRDQPVMTKGRFREFYQCDFDIAGQYDSMLPDAECLRVADEILSALDLGEYEIRLNHRALLEGIFSLSGIDAKDFKTVCSSVDKLDKVPWEQVRDELLNEKGIASEATEKLEKFVRSRGKNLFMML